MTNTVTIYDYEDAYKLPPSDLTEYIAWLQKKLNKIPAQYRPAARTEIYGCESNDSISLNYTITYERPETKKEAIARMAADHASAEAVRFRELAMLEALRVKYEASVSPLPL